MGAQIEASVRARSKLTHYVSRELINSLYELRRIMSGGSGAKRRKIGEKLRETRGSGTKTV